MTSRLTLLPVLAVVLAGLAGCATSPRALGLTGAQAHTPPAAPQDSTIGLPGLPEPGGGQSSGFGTPNGGSGGRYYGTP
ncbi:MAG: hypothetical protein ACREFY_04835 [Acetobacteraceae bacterium]